MPVISETAFHSPIPGRTTRNPRNPRPAAPTRILTVGELIAMLQVEDPGAPVVMRGQYGGFECVHAVATQPLRLNVNRQDGFGPHDRPNDGEAADIVALAIGGGTDRLSY